MAAGGTPNGVHLFNVANRTPTGPPLAGHTGKVTDLASGPDGKTLVTSSTDKTVRVFALP